MAISFQLSGFAHTCVNVLEHEAGEADLARFDLMWPAAMPSAMCWSQYLLGCFPLRARGPPHCMHVASTIVRTRQQQAGRAAGTSG